MYAPYHFKPIDYTTYSTGDSVSIPNQGSNGMASPTNHSAKRPPRSRFSRTTQPSKPSQQPPSPKRSRFERSLAPSPSPPPTSCPPPTSPLSPTPYEPPKSSSPTSSISSASSQSPPLRPLQATPTSTLLVAPPQLYNATPLTTILNHPYYGPLPQTPVDPRELSRREVKFHTMYPGNRGYEIAEAMELGMGLRFGVKGRVDSEAVSPKSLSPERGGGVGGDGRGVGMRNGDWGERSGRVVVGEDVGDDGGMVVALQEGVEGAGDDDDDDDGGGGDNGDDGGRLDEDEWTDMRAVGGMVRVASEVGVKRMRLDVVQLGGDDEGM